MKVPNFYLIKTQEFTDIESKDFGKYLHKKSFSEKVEKIYNVQIIFPVLIQTKSPKKNSYFDKYTHFCVFEVAWLFKNY